MFFVQKGCQRLLIRQCIRCMAGHSKWSNIRHKKKSNDIQRGKEFAKLAKTIESASRMAGGDREHHLVTAAVARARDADMPKSRIETAIERGALKSRDKTSSSVDLMTFEMNFRGIGIIVEALTDNHSRTAQEIRAIARKFGAHMGAENSILWNWKRIGLLKVSWLTDDEARRDDLFTAALNGGADDLEEAQEDHSINVFTEPHHLHATRLALSTAGFEVDSSELTWRPNGELIHPASDSLIDFQSILEALDNQSDVSAVYHDAQF